MTHLARAVLRIAHDRDAAPGEPQVTWTLRDVEGGAEYRVRNFLVPDGVGPPAPLYFEVEDGRIFRVARADLTVIKPWPGSWNLDHSAPPGHATDEEGDTGIRLAAQIDLVERFGATHDGEFPATSRACLAVVAELRRLRADVERPTKRRDEVQS
jgi:hypothetical protein